MAATLALWLGGCSDPPRVDEPDAGDSTANSGEQRYGCTGVPVRCDESDDLRCLGQAGCYWQGSADGSAGNCRGLAGPCSYFRNEDSCGDQEGCAWTEIAAHFDSIPSEGCTGSAEPCADANSSQCTDRLGCAWNAALSVCNGETVICAHRYVEALCKRGAGCDWRPLQ